MKSIDYFRKLSVPACVLISFTACGSSDGDDEKTTDPPVLSAGRALDLNDVKSNPTEYEWFDFRPNVEKLILAGAAETEHIAILWYTVADGGVGLHYHSKTESVYVIDGTQTDAKGNYPTGTVYFNPPGSGHQIMDSSGFFVLAYAAPPDFSAASTDLIGEYEPVRIDTTDPDLTSTYAFEEKIKDVSVFSMPLDASGGLSAEFIETTSSTAYAFTGNYLLVLKGSCDIDGLTFGEQQLVVTDITEPNTYELAASKGSSCLAMGVSF